MPEDPASRPSKPEPPHPVRALLPRIAGVFLQNCPHSRVRRCCPVWSVAALVGDRVAAFELGVACQVFGLDRSDDGLPVHDFAVCGPRPGRVPTTSGFDIDVPHGLDRVASADLVVVPAWPTLDAPLPGGVAEAL